jgi:hypothetical protein
MDYNNMTEETEQERKVREYWARVYKTSIYDISSLDLTLNNDNSSSSNNSNSKLPYEPTAVLSPPPKQRKFRLSDIVNLDFTRE